MIQIADANLRGRGGGPDRQEFYPAGCRLSTPPTTRRKRARHVQRRQLLEKNPHQVIEGALIAAYAIQATAVYIYCRRSSGSAHALEEQIEIAKQNNFVERTSSAAGGVARSTSTRAGRTSAARKALLNSLQGRSAAARPLALPRAARWRLYYAPTVVNNVETLANAVIMRNGADAQGDSRRR